jgi:RP/EB family microtubule-associated protein
MDNLEFMQWFKRYYELSGTVKGDYDGAAVRLKGKGAENEKPKAPGAKPVTITGGTVAPSAVPKPAPAATKKETVTATAKPPAPPAAAPKPAAPVAAAKAAAAAKPLKENKAPAASAPSSSSSAAKDKAVSGDSSSAAEIAALKQVNEEAQQTVSELRVEMEGLEKERDFYFDKLRDIEILLQENEDAGKKSEVSDAIFAILYKTADGFAAIETAPQSATKASKEDPVGAFPLESVEEASEVESY